ncbi:hypothetical protein ELAN_17850 [Elizabethkingia anophelis]|nr:MAG: hypothetical protein PQ275_13490 [Elizabethkingia anophelis]GJN58230.1 hypothetical protein ELAN_17850 [Elizabethkingia anophelis]
MYVRSANIKNNSTMKNTLMALSLVLGLGYATAQQTTPAQKKSEPAKKEAKGHDHAKKEEKKAEKTAPVKQEKTPVKK